MRELQPQPTVANDYDTLREALTHLFYPDEPNFGMAKVVDANAALTRLAVKAGFRWGAGDE